MSKECPFLLLWDILWLLHCCLCGLDNHAGNYTTYCLYNTQLPWIILLRNSVGLPHASDCVLLLVFTFVLDSV